LEPGGGSATVGALNDHVAEWNARASFFVDYQAMCPEWPAGHDRNDRAKVLARTI
jgi:hypothetical protein